MTEGIKTYCLGVGCMTKCNTCQHDHNWHMLNQMPDILRKSIQATARRIPQDACQLTSGLYFSPMKGGA